MDIKYILHTFPRLNIANFNVTSPQTSSYNCIAWAAEEDIRSWWPVHGYWPKGVPNEVTLEAFEEAYATLGYKKCKDGKKEKGKIKIAIYIDNAIGRPTHAARQLTNGKWTSKLGQEHDIEHDAADLLCGSQYGNIAMYMSKKI